MSVLDDLSEGVRAIIGPSGEVTIVDVVQDSEYRYVEFFCNDADCSSCIDGRPHRLHGWFLDRLDEQGDVEVIA